MSKEIRIVILYIINLIAIYVLSFSIIIKPSLAGLIPYKIVNLEFVVFLIYLFYPFYFGTLILFLKMKKRSVVNNLIFFSTIFLSSAVILLNYGLIFVESLKYPNYVYSTFHIYLPYLNNFSSLQIFILVASVLIYSKRVDLNEILSSKSINAFLYNLKKPHLLLFTLIIVLISSFIPTYIRLAIYEFGLLNKISNQQIEFRLRTVDLWTIALKMDKIAKLIPDDSVVFIPPQTWDFPEIGNQVLARYYLYPRTLVSPGKTGLYIKENNVCKIYYIILEKGRFEGEYFPEEEIAFQKAILISRSGEVKEFYNGIYNTSFKGQIENLDLGIIEKTLCK